MKLLFIKSMYIIIIIVLSVQQLNSPRWRDRCWCCQSVAPMWSSVTPTLSQLLLSLCHHFKQPS